MGLEVIRQEMEYPSEGTCEAHPPSNRYTEVYNAIEA
jgi:hypothetical protein